MSDLEGLTQFTLTGLTSAILADSSDDGSNLDAVGVRVGVTITARPEVVRLATTPGRTVRIRPVKVRIEDGVLVLPKGAVGDVRLVADTEVLGITGHLLYDVKFGVGVVGNDQIDFGDQNFTFAAPASDTSVSLDKVERLKGNTPAGTQLRMVPDRVRLNGDGQMVFSANGIDLPDPLTVEGGVGGPADMDDITDATTVGKAVARAASQAAARSAIGAGTSSLVVGTSSSTAKAGDYQPAAANIVDSTETGCAVVTAANAAAARSAIGAGTSSLALGTAAGTAKAGDYQPAAANISDSTAVGRSVVTAADAAAARSVIGAGTSSLALGTSGSTAAAGNDARLTDTRTPTDATVTTAKIVDANVSLAKLAAGVQTSLGKADAAAAAADVVIEVAAGTGVAATDTAAINTAITNVADGGTVRLRRGSSYTVTALTASDKNITIDGNGATLIGSTNSTIFTYTGGWEWTRSVSAISEQTSNSQPVTRLTVSDTSALKVGDVVRVFATDAIPGSKPGPGTTSRRIAEYAIVGDIDAGNGYIYLTGRVQETYVTSIKVAKLKRRRLVLKDVKLDRTDAQIAGVDDPYALEIRAAWGPILSNVRIVRGCSLGIVFRGCYSYRADNCSIDWLPNDPTNFRYGYGIADTSSEYGVVTGLNATNVRHGYTTTTEAIETTESDPMYYGRTAHARVIGGTAVGASAGFDTHDEAYDIVFSNCITYGSYLATATGSSSSAGFEARGRQITFQNCKAFNCRYGFLIFEQYDLSTDRVTLDHCEAINCSDYGLYTRILTTAGATGTRVRNLRVIGGKYEGRQAGALLDHADVNLIGRPLFRVVASPTPLANAHGVWAISTTVLTADSLTVDVSESNATANNVVRVESAASALGLDRGEVISGSNTISQVFSGASTPGSVDARNWVLDKAPASASAGFSSISLEWRVRGNAAVGSGLVDPKMSQIVDTNGNPIMSFQPVAGGVTCLQASNSAGATATLKVTGPGSNLSVSVVPRGTGVVRLQDSAGAQVFSTAAGVASAVNYLTATNAATGNAPALSATGTDTNVDLNLVPRGSGVVKANGAELATKSYVASATGATATNSGLLGWTQDPAVVSQTGTMLPAAATVYACLIPIATPQTVSNIVVNLTAVGATLTHSYLALFKSDGTILGQTADQSTTWVSAAGTPGPKTAALTSPVLVTPSGANDFVWAAIYVGTAGTLPAFGRGGTSAAIINVGTSSTRRRYGYIAQADTATLTAVTPSSMALAAQAYWMALS